MLVCGSPVSERHNWLTAYRALEYAVTLRVFRGGQHAMGVITAAACGAPCHDLSLSTVVNDPELLENTLFVAALDHEAYVRGPAHRPDIARLLAQR